MRAPISARADILPPDTFLMDVGAQTDSRTLPSPPPPWKRRCVRTLAAEHPVDTDVSEIPAAGSNKAAGGTASGISVHRSARISARCPFEFLGWPGMDTRCIGCIQEKLKKLCVAGSRRVGGVVSWSTSREANIRTPALKKAHPNSKDSE